MQPGLEEIQTSLNKATQLVIEISKHVYQWGQDRDKQLPKDQMKDSRRYSAVTMIGGLPGLGIYKVV